MTEAAQARSKEAQAQSRDKLAAARAERELAEQRHRVEERKSEQHMAALTRARAERQARDRILATHWRRGQLKERGWTDGEIERFLGEPATRLRVRGSYQLEVAFWPRERVHAVEASPEYQAHHTRWASRRRPLTPQDKAARNAAAVKRAQQARILAHRRAQGYAWANEERAP